MQVFAHFTSVVAQKRTIIWGKDGLVFLIPPLKLQVQHPFSWRICCMSKTYTHLTLDDRITIQLLLDAKPRALNLDPRI